ncbi:MAG TPA: adenylate/guanylate cyclase domain-containing protein, partial [Longimicrobiaceae bacterium]|nr:adenylate/guanylate cyclase domain-containing protein [Longimicrobiaceae bacterium]
MKTFTRMYGDAASGGLALSFSDRTLESRFLETYNRTYVVQARLALALAVVLLFVDALVDTLAYPAESSLGNAIRLLAVAPFIALGILGSFAERVRRSFQVYTLVWGVIMAGILFGAMVVLERGGGQGLSSWVGLLNFVFAQIFAFILLGLQFRYAVILGLLVFLQFWGLLYFTGAFDTAGILYYGYHLFSVVLLIMFLSYWREYFIRRDFLLKLDIERERERSEALLYSILPRSIAERVLRGQHPIADAHAEATVLFADLVNFTRLTASIGPHHLVEVLDSLFSSFDEIVARHALEKVKTIGDAYMAVGTLTSAPERRTGEVAVEVIRAAFEMIETAQSKGAELGYALDMRAGVHTGPVIAGVIGRARYH